MISLCFPCLLFLATKDHYLSVYMVRSWFEANGPLLVGASFQYMLFPILPKCQACRVCSVPSDIPICSAASVAVEPGQRLVSSVSRASSICSFQQCLLVLTFMSLVTHGLEHRFLWLFLMCLSSLVKCLLRSWGSFFITIGLFSFWWLLNVHHIFWIDFLY